MAIYPTRGGFGVDWRDEFGRRHRKYVGTESAARRMDAELRTQGNQSRLMVKNYQSAEAIDLTTARDLYITHSALSPVSKTWQNERLGQLAKTLGNITLAALTPQRLDEYVAARRQRLAPSSLARECGLIKGFCAWLARNWYLPTTPADHLISNQPRRSSGRAITYDEERHIFAVAYDRLRCKLLLALDAGLRRAECNALKFNHLNLSEGTMTVYATKTRTFRTIPLTPRLQQALTIASQGRAPDSHVNTWKGQGIKKGNDAIARLRAKSRINFRFHDLRQHADSRIMPTTR